MSVPSYTHICTDEINWVEDPDIPGFKQKILGKDPQTNAVVRLWFIPPEWGGDILDGKPDRHYHKTVVERAFHLSGDFPHWEFSSVDDFEGELYIFSRGLFMDRPPGSLHGLLPTPTSQAGAQILYWNTGSGTSIREAEFEHETINVPFDAQTKLKIDSVTPCRLIETDDLVWQPHPFLTGAKIKYLADAHHGADPVVMVHIPAGWHSRAVIDVKGSASHRPWLYAIYGDLAVTVGDEALRLRTSDFFAWTSGADPRFAGGEVSEEGCTLICSGHQLGSDVTLTKS